MSDPKDHSSGLGDSYKIWDQQRLDEMTEPKQAGPTEELKPCPYCGNPVQDNGKDVWCNCRMFAPSDRHKNAYCWKLLASEREKQEKRITELEDDRNHHQKRAEYLSSLAIEAEKRVEAYREVAIICEKGFRAKAQYKYHNTPDQFVDAEAERLLKETGEKE